MRTVILGALFFALAVDAALAEKRVALVVGQFEL